jgi:LDH2 family malate/lactate/ureidoglycolate dehydrogenase
MPDRVFRRGLHCGDYMNESDHDGNVVIAVHPEAMIGTQRYLEEVAKMTKAIKHAKKLEGVEEVMLPGERGDRMRRRILAHDQIDVEENLLNNLVAFVQGPYTAHNVDGKSQVESP